MKNKILYISSIILGVYFLIRLIDQSQMISAFPLDFTNDWSSYIAQLHFLKECGFHNFCPYWYNGFESFLITAPGWMFFVLPIYLLTNNILLSSFISLIVLYILGFVFIYLLGRNEQISKAKTLFFFLLFFGNAIAIGNFVRLGRIVSLFGFICFLALALIIFYYRDKKLDKKFLLFIPTYSILLISHQQESVLGSFLVLGLFLVNKERIKIIIFSLISVLLSSFWLVPFILNSWNTSLFGYEQSNLLNLLLENNIYLWTNIAATLISIGVFVMFYFYWKENKKELLFFSPVLVLNFLFMFRLISFIPILKHISPDPFILFFLFFILFFLTKIRFKNNLKILVWSIVLFVAVINVTVSHYNTPYFTPYQELEIETLSLLPEIEENYIMIGAPGVTSYSKAYYSYGAIYHNLRSSYGWYNQIVSDEYVNIFRGLDQVYYEGDCVEFNDRLKRANATEVLFYGFDCDKINSCGLKEKDSKKNACLYRR